jgi:hypothetical protein
MGNSKFGNDSSATGFSKLRTVGGNPDYPVRFIYATDPKMYSSDRYPGDRAGEDQPFGLGDSFRYGGPGKCSGDPKVVSAEPVVPPKAVAPPTTTTKPGSTVEMV